RSESGWRNHRPIEMDFNVESVAHRHRAAEVHIFLKGQVKIVEAVGQAGEILDHVRRCVGCTFVTREAILVMFLDRFVDWVATVRSGRYWIGAPGSPVREAK